MLTTDYRGIKITYDEVRDRWTFSMSGRELSAESLAQAKYKIDHPPKDRAAFKRQLVWVEIFRYTTGWRKVTLTSIDESGLWGWASDGKNRERVRLARTFADTPENAKRIAEIQENTAVMNGLHQRIEILEAKLTSLKI